MEDHKEIREVIENYRIGKVSNFPFKQFIQWLRQLLDENEALKDGSWKAISEIVQRENTKLQADKAAAVKALRFYADSENYCNVLGIRILGDAGRRARTALESGDKE